jgi:hypothetical protein
MRRGVGVTGAHQKAIHRLGVGVGIENRCHERWLERALAIPRRRNNTSACECELPNDKYMLAIPSSDPRKSICGVRT